MCLQLFFALFIGVMKLDVQGLTAILKIFFAMEEA